ncbi:hypothetical protein F0562_030660 [Nyssa sinensis]|uniref:Protein kinase domain-containing protein n=1 Tax=Nyssa sinensis TaxID=561372 RepID=A0A5J5B1I5_9ASTE|nr:hypothetical protein F0562_030660 [Nyssa sinensis]
MPKLFSAGLALPFLSNYLFNSSRSFDHFQVLFIVKIVLVVVVCRRRGRRSSSNTVSPDSPDTPNLTLTMVKFLDDMEREKPIRFTSQQLMIATNNFRNLLVGTARGIAYLHEECRQRIIHYDIKPGNIVLDAQFCPKVADFGLAKLYNRDNTHIIMTGRRGTPGFAAPELGMPLPKSHKCDVYSFGMLLFEIVGRRKNLDFNLPESQEWFPRWVWNKFEKGESRDLMTVCAIEEEDKEKAEKMVKVALWCVQYRPESRPLMSVVVKMLEGEVEIPAPLNPFHYLSAGSSPAIVAPMALNGSGFGSGSSQMVTGSSLVTETPITRRLKSK